MTVGRSGAAVRAARYGVELVGLDRLQEAASPHGTPLPDSLGPDTQPEEAPALTAAPATPQQAGANLEATAARRARIEPTPGPESIRFRERVGIALLLLSGGAFACGSLMWLGRGSTAMIGLVLILGGVVAMALIVWGLERHGAAKRARDRRRPRGRGHLAPVFSEAEFEAIEDALEPARKPGDGIIS